MYFLDIYIEVFIGEIIFEICFKYLFFKKRLCIGIDEKKGRKMKVDSC